MIHTQPCIALRAQSESVMTTKKRIACLLVAAIGVGALAMAGLGNRSSPDSGYIAPNHAIAKPVRLYFKPISVGGPELRGGLLVDAMNGANLSVSGTLLAVTEDWISVSMISGYKSDGTPTYDYVSFERDAVYAIRVDTVHFN